MKKLIFANLLISIFLVFPQNARATTECPNVPLSGNYTVTTPSPGCYIAAAGTAAGIDFAGGNETSTTNSAVLTVGAGSTLTIPSGPAPESLTKLLTGSITIQDGATVVIGSNAQIKLSAPVYVADTDADGWAEGFTYYDATSSGRRRKSLMRSISTADCSGTTYSEANSCGYRRNIALTYSGTTLTNHDIVWGVDTATAIAAGKMTADCGDIRVKDSDGTTALSYWIEGGCNTASTQIWTRVPSIPDGGKTIYMDYDGTTTANGFEAWSGTFTLMNTAACPSGWSSNADFHNLFPRGAATYGETGGASSHAHNNATCTASGGTNNAPRDAGSGSICQAHQTHTHSGATVSVNTASNVNPPYTKMVMCKSANLYIDAGLVALFNTAVGTGWTRFTAMDSEFLMGHNTTYGGTGGSTTHSHSTTGGTTTAASATTCVRGSNVLNTCGSHTHSSQNGTSDTGDNTPPYLNMIFGSKNADGAAKAGVIAIVDVLPPLGWIRFTALDNNFVRGSSSYGGTGGTTTHNHSVTINVSENCNFIKVLASTGAGSSSHAHSCTDSGVGTQSNLPPYVNAVFAQRNTPTPTVNVGSEGSQ